MSPCAPAAATSPRGARRRAPRRRSRPRDAGIQRALDSPFDLRGRAAARDRPGVRGGGPGQGSRAASRRRPTSAASPSRNGRHLPGHARVPAPGGAARHRRVHALRPAVRDELPDRRRARGSRRPGSRSPASCTLGPGPLPGEDRGARQEQRAARQPDPRLRGALPGRPPRVEPRPERPPPRGPRGGRGGRSPSPAGRSRLRDCSTAASRSTAPRTTPRPACPASPRASPCAGRTGASSRAAPETPLRPGPDGDARPHPRLPARRRAPGTLRGDRARDRPRRRGRWPRPGSRS